MCDSPSDCELKFIPTGGTGIGEAGAMGSPGNPVDGWFGPGEP